jgi:pilus assembly protein CpaE
MPPHISIVVIDRDDQSRQTINAMLASLGDSVRLEGSVGNYNDGVSLIQRTNPMVVMVDVDEQGAGVDRIRHLHDRFPRTSIFVMSAKRDTDWILNLMRAGAVEYLLKPLVEIELTESLQKIGRIWIQRPSDVGERGKVISVYNPVGGMGTTTIAVNLAAALASDNEKVALVDLNLICGDVASFLDVAPTYTLSSVTSNIARLDANFLMTVMTRHSTGIYILTEPLEVHESFDITGEQIKRMLAFLRGIFSYVIIDTGGLLTGGPMAIFESSDFILFNSVLNLPALKNAKRYLSAMERAGLHKDKIKLIVNRYAPKEDIKIADAERVLGTTIFQTVPNDYSAVISSINRGTPIVRLMPGSPVSKAILKLAEMLKR